MVGTDRRFVDEGVPTTPRLPVWSEVRRHVPAVAVTTDIGAPVADPVTPAPGAPLAAARRSARAVMPLMAAKDGLATQGFADGPSHDVRTRMAKLRRLSVIARGSGCSLADKGIPALEAGWSQGIDYPAVGALRRKPCSLRIGVELVETRSDRIVPGQRFGTPTVDGSRCRKIWATGSSRPWCEKSSRRSAIGRSRDPPHRSTPKARITAAPGTWSASPGRTTHMRSISSLMS